MPASSCWCLLTRCLSLIVRAPCRFATGCVIGWLPPDQSDFVNNDGQPAALWRLHFDEMFEPDKDSEDWTRQDPSILGFEDLEEHEVLQGIALFRNCSSIYIRSWYGERPCDFVSYGLRI